MPGFLLAFCARVDEAARLVGKHTSAGIDFDVPEKWYQGYWFPLMIAYSLGLFLTFMSLVLTEKGQPALFYIVPLCLGTMLVLGRKHLKDLWRGAKQIRLADKLKRKCEKAWGQERMKRLVAKKKRERALEDEHEKQRGVRRIRSGESMASSIDASGNIDDHNNRQHRSSVGGRGGRGRGRGSGGRGRGRGRGPGRGSSGRSRGPSRVQGNGSRSQNDVADKSNTRETSSAKTNEETITKESPDEDDDSWPTVNDVCFGDKVHPGTKEFHKVVQNAAQSFADEEYGPVIYKSVKKQLKGKRFFNVDGQDASASEIKAEVKKAFNKEKMRR